MMLKTNSLPNKLELDISSINKNNLSNIPFKDNSQQEMFNSPLSPQNTISSSNKLNIISTISSDQPQQNPTEYINIMKLCSKLFRKFLPFCKSWSIIIQIIVVYALLLIIFVIIIIYSKIVEVNNLIETHSTKNYYVSIVKEIIDVQRYLKVDLDKLNDDLYISNIERPVLLMRIYTQELLHHNILHSDTSSKTFISKADETKDYYINISPSFEMSVSLTNMIKESSGLNYNIKNLIPFYYHFVPVIYQNMLLQGIPLINFYFLGFTTESSIPPMYFKYPLEQSSVPKGASPSNNKIFDFVLDPVGAQYINEINKEGGYEDKDKLEELISTVKKVNWFSKLEETVENKAKQISKMLKLVKINNNNAKEEYLMKYLYIEYQNKDVNKAITLSMKNTNQTKTNSFPLNSFKMLFANKLNYTTMYRPYIILNSNNDINNTYSIILINYPNAFNTMIPVFSSNIYEVDYNIDDNNTQIIALPKFIDNLFKYSLLDDSINAKNKSINIKTNIIKYPEIDNITAAYDVNYYYKRDSIFFQLLVFLNHNLNYYSQYSTSEEHPTNYNPCHIKDIEQYYQDIKEKGINCLKDFCFFNECNSTSKLYVNPKQSQFLPNCYCLPLYCMDNKTPPLFSFLQKIKKYYPNEADKFYTFNVDHKKYNEYFDLDNLEFKCRLNFNQKETDKISSFNSIISLKNPLFNSTTSIFEMYLMSNNEIETRILRNYSTFVKDIRWIVFLIYFFCICITVGVLNYFMYINAYMLRGKIRMFDDYKKEIIPMSENSSKAGNKDEENSLIANNKLINNTNEDQINKEVFEDELDQISNIIKKNLKNLKIEFDINESINNKTSHLMNKQYIEANNVNIYKKRLFYSKKDKSKSYKNITVSKLSLKEDLRNSSKNEESELILKDKIEDISLNLLYEILSMSDKSLIDFSNITSNFYYSEDTTKSFIDASLIKNFINEDISNSNEMTDDKRIKHAIKYYISNIHDYWKKKYSESKDQEKEL